MHHHIRTFSRIVAICTVTLASPQFLPAQLPPGQLLVAGFNAPGYVPGLGGLFFVDTATTPATVTAVTGLPCELTGACTHPNTPWTGPDVVLRLPTTQQIVTNGPVWVGVMLNAYVLTLSGSAVTHVTVHPLATYSTVNGLGNPGAALLADERVLLSIDPGSMVAPGPLAGAFLGILDPILPANHPNAVMPVPVSPIPPGITNSLAVDRDRGLAYVGMTNGRIYAIPVPGGGTPVQVAMVPGGTAAMVVEPSGKLLVGGWASNPQQGRLWRVDATTGLVTTVSSGIGTDGANAVWMDAVSGDITFAQCDSVAQQSPLRQIDAQGVVTNLTNGPVSGWGCVSGIDGWARIETFGAASGSAPIARWTLAPNPGGAVTLGNTAFTLTNAPPPSAVLSMWALGFARATPPVALPTAPATTLLVQPVLTVFFAQQAALPLALPANQAFSGVEINVQCWHWDGAAQLSASGGLHLTL